VGKHADEVVSELKLDDPLLPIKKLLTYNPNIILVGVDLTATTSIHLAKVGKSSMASPDERALTVSSKGLNWVNIKGLGCSNGFQKLASHLAKREPKIIGTANAEVYSMKELVETGRSILKKDQNALNCDNQSCLSCAAR
jgi:aminoglycoside N3'-acetyltransferase